MKFLEISTCEIDVQIVDFMHSKMLNEQHWERTTLILKM